MPSKQRKPLQSPVVLYLRMSSEKQDKSIPQQRKAAREFAKRRGYRIVAEYVDEGISGMETARRPQFRQMIADAPTAVWRAILVWDQSRFGRFDAIEAGQWLQPLQQADISIVLVASDRVVDLNTREGRFMFVFDAEANRDYIEKLSHNSLRGRLEAAEAGRWTGGRVPYGYDRKIIDTETGETKIKPRRSRYACGSKERVVLVPNETEAAIVRFIFEEFASGRLTRRAIAKHLTARGIAGPLEGKAIRGRKVVGWNTERIRKILTSPVYVGIRTFGRYAGGKLNRWEPGEGIVQVRRQQAGWRQSGWMERDGEHEGIIPRELFDKAQAKLNRVRDAQQTDRVGRGRQRVGKESSPYALTGVLHCGHCGSPMVGKIPKNDRKGRTLYRCANADRKPGTCGHWSIQEDAVLPYLIDRLWDQMGRRTLAEVENQAIDRMRRAVEVESANDTIDRIEQELAALERRIREARERLLTLPADMTAGLVEVIRDWQTERDMTERELAQARETAMGDTPESDWYHVWRTEVHQQLVKVSPGPEGWRDPKTGRINTCPGVHLDIATLQDLFRTARARVDLHFRQRDDWQPGRRDRWELSEGQYRIGVGVQQQHGKVITQNDSTTPALMPGSCGDPHAQRLHGMSNIKHDPPSTTDLSNGERA